MNKWKIFMMYLLVLALLTMPLLACGDDGKSYGLTISVDPSGGGATSPSAGTHTYDENKVVTITATATEGYIFDSWTGDVSDTSSASTTVTMDSDQVVTANFALREYTITFDSNGGSAVSSITQDYGTSVTPPADPTRENYTFSGWIPSVPATIPAGDTTCVAQWTINQYTITFDNNGGSAVSPISQVYGTSVTPPADPTREGCTFSGWDPSVPSTMPATDTTCVAQWTANPYTITFDSTGGIAILPITQDYGTLVTPPADPTRENYTFSGWIPSVPATIPAGDTTCVAQWTINQYTITFDSAGGSAVSPITQDYGTSVTPPAEPTRKGYIFSGWDASVPSTMPATDTTCVAQWTINPWPEITLRLAYGMNETQVGAKTAQKFADLLEEHTYGAVQVDIYPAGTLITYAEEFEAVRAGVVDITWTNPFFLRAQDPNLDFTGAIPFAYSNLAHLRSVVAEGRLEDYTNNRLEDEYGIHLLGYCEIAHMGGYFTNAHPIEDYTDLDGLHLSLFNSGSVNPYEEWCGMTGQYVMYPYLIDKILDGTIDTISNLVDAEVTLGFINYLKYGWCAVNGSYMTPLFNLDKWNSLGPDLQDLITNVIIPEVQEYARQLVVEDEKYWWGIANEEMDSITIAPPDHNAVAWEGMQSQASMQDLLDGMDPLILEVIEELRPPTPTTYDQDIIEVLEYAGIPY